MVSQTSSLSVGLYRLMASYFIYFKPDVATENQSIIYIYLYIYMYKFLILNLMKPLIFSVIQLAFPSLNVAI